MADFFDKKSPLSSDEEYKKYVRKKKITAKVSKILISFFRAVLVIGICYYVVYPLLAKVFCSFMAQEDLYDTTVGLIPKTWTLENYKIAFTQMDYFKTLLTTIGLSVMMTVFQVASCTLVGYGFARFKFPLKNLLFAFVIFTLIVPPTLIVTPMYVNFRFFDIFGIIKLFTAGRGINLTDSVWSLIIMAATCMGFKNGLYVYLIRQFYRGVPKELEEAALIDGAGHFRTFWSVMLLSAKPIITVVTMFSLVWQWTDVFYVQSFMRGASDFSNALSSLATKAAVALMGAGGKFDSGYTNIINSTGILLVILPLIVFYVFAQKQFVEGVERSGIVG